MIKPSAIGLEASSHCQLRCPSCPTTTKAIHPAVGSGFLRFADFRKLIDDNPWVKEVELSNYGEIFLNPELLEIIEYAFRKQIALSAVNGVNLNHATPEMLEGLVKYRFQSIRCSIDGASQETYRIYRVRGSFERVIANIRTLNGFKRQYGSPHPLLLWQFIAFGHNEHEIPAARKLAAELGMAFQVKLSWDDGCSPVRDRDRIGKETGAGAATRAEFREQHGTDYMQSLCHQLWDRPQINWDGKVLGCCRNFWGDFGGNVFRDGLLPSLNNEKLVHARAMLTGEREARPDIPCSTCDIYLHRKAHQQWVTPRPIAKIRRDVERV